LDIRGMNKVDGKQFCKMRSLIICILLFTRRVIKSRRMKWTGHMTRMGMIRNAYTILFGKLKCTNYSEEPMRMCENNIKTSIKNVKSIAIRFIFQCMKVHS
jgi:hypothetical protein